MSSDMEGRMQDQIEGAIRQAEEFDVAALLEDAAETIRDWGGYASEYFRQKHDLDRDVQRFKDAAAYARRIGLAPPQPTPSQPARHIRW